MKKNLRQKGFTLIEIMVSVTIFLIVMVTAIGSILSLTNANRKAQALNSVMSNLNFAVDAMVRDIKTGVAYNCGGSVQQTYNDQQAADCANSSSLSLISSSGDAVSYRLGSSAECDGGRCIVEDIESGASSVITKKITAIPDIAVTKLNFSVNGSLQNDSKQPEVLVQIQGTAGTSANISTTFNIQTLVSQRLLDS